MGYLGNLNQLQGSLTLGLWGSNDVEQARMSNLGNKNHIKELELIFGFGERLDDAVLEALSPPPNLQILHIYTGSKDPLINSNYLPFLMSVCVPICLHSENCRLSRSSLYMDVISNA